MSSNMFFFFWYIQTLVMCGLSFRFSWQIYSSLPSCIFMCVSGGHNETPQTVADGSKSGQGIFIKLVKADSPAGRDGFIKTGDRILEVIMRNSSRKVSM